MSIAIGRTVFYAVLLVSMSGWFAVLGSGITHGRLRSIMLLLTFIVFTGVFLGWYSLLSELFRPLDVTGDLFVSLLLLSFGEACLGAGAGSLVCGVVADKQDGSFMLGLGSLLTVSGLGCFILLVR